MLGTILIIILALTFVIDKYFSYKWSKQQNERITYLSDKIICIETRIKDNIIEYPKDKYADYRNPDTGLLGRKRK